MNNSKTDRVQNPEEGILEVLKSKNTETSLADLIESLRALGFGEDSLIKTAIWHLISDSMIEMTPDQKLRIHA